MAAVPPSVCSAEVNCAGGAVPAAEPPFPLPPPGMVLLVDADPLPAARGFGAPRLGSGRAAGASPGGNIK